VTMTDLDMALAESFDEVFGLKNAAAPATAP
jgi:hypothetical protein